MKIRQINYTWPGGLSGAVTSSWDDGCIHDPRLVEILNGNGLRGTFHLCSGLLRGEGRNDPFYLHEDDVRRLYAGHEIAAHSLTHPNLWTLSDDLVFNQLLEDRRNLERLAGYPVRTVVFPCGRGGDDDRLEAIARRAGFRLARASHLKGVFAPPSNWLCWGTAGHVADDLDGLWTRFEAMPIHDKVFFWWGHSHEFEGKLGWERLEKFAARFSGPRWWHATNREIYDYVEAWRRLVWTHELDVVRNPSALDVWILPLGKDPVKVPAGATLGLA